MFGALRAAATPERVAREKRYHKSSWEYWGVPATRMDAVPRPILADLSGADRLALARSRWVEPVWDLNDVTPDQF